MSENSIQGSAVVTELPQTDWSALALGLLLLLGATGLVTTAPLLAILGLSTLTKVNTGQPLTLLMLGAGTFALGLLLVPGLVLNARKFFNVPDQSFRFPNLPVPLLLPALVAVWIVTLLLGSSLPSAGILTALLLPVLNILAVTLPIGVYLLISLRGLPLPTARRGWSVFGASAILGPSLTVVLELVAFLGVLLLYSLYASSVPGLSETLNNLIAAFQDQSPSLEYLSKEAAVLFFAPGTTMALLGLLSLAVPLIEEGLKVFLLWFYAGRLRRPVEGFVLGVLCGAAFALAENIGFASAGASDWTSSVFSRATAALPHMFNSGLMGWALVSAWRDKKYARLGLTYLTVVLIHGSWNALSIALAFSSLGEFVAGLPAIVETPLPALAAWGVLAVGLVFGLFFANTQMRKQAAKDLAENVEYNPPLRLQNSGENHGTVETTD